MATLDFITSNPATDAFQRAEKLARENDLSDLKLQTGLRENEEGKITFPTRLRKLEADTSTSETGSQVAKAEAPYAAPLKQARLRNDTAHATSAETDAEFAPEKARTGLRAARAGATNAELEPFSRSVKLLEAGDIEGAKELARQAGQTIPDSVLNDADMRRAVIDGWKKAQELYPSRPRDQQSYMTGYIRDMNERRAAGANAGEPTAPYSVKNPPEAPLESQNFKDRWQALPATRRSPETGETEQGYIKFNQTDGSQEFITGTTIQSRAGGPTGGGKSSVFQQKQQAWLQSHPGDDQGALDYASGRRQMSESEIASSALKMARTELNTNAMLKFKPAAEQTDFIQKRALEIANQIRSGFAGPGKQSSVGNGEITTIASVPGPITNPSVPPRPDMMTPGDGGKPIDMQLPPTPAGVPPGSAYSPSRKMWRSGDGRVFDETGAPVSQ